MRGIGDPNVVVGMALGVGGLVQLLAGMWEFATGNTFGATGECDPPDFPSFFLLVGVRFSSGASLGVASHPKQARGRNPTS